MSFFLSQSDTYFCMSVRLPTDEEAFVSKCELDGAGGGPWEERQLFEISESFSLMVMSALIFYCQFLKRIDNA